MLVTMAMVAQHKAHDINITRSPQLSSIINKRAKDADSKKKKGLRGGLDSQMKEPPSPPPLACAGQWNGGGM